MIKALIVDDEIDAQITIEAFLLKYCPAINEIRKASGVESAIQTIKEFKPNMVFLDINLQDGTGFDVLEKSEIDELEIIFTTAYDEYAIKAFKVKAIDYLLKPINPLELKEATERACGLILDKNELRTIKELIKDIKIEKLGVPLKDKVEFKNLKDIIRFEADANYTNILFQNGQTVLVAKTLKKFEELLSSKSFLRVHQSHLVNLDSIQSFDQKLSILLLTNRDSVPVSRRYKSDLIRLLRMKII